MDLATFWAIIEATRVPDADLPMARGPSDTVREASARSGLEQFAQANRLTGALSVLTEEEVKAFIVRFEEVSTRAERWDIVGAASLLGQGGDDGFVYFRCWLIAQGQDTFEAALENPDSLAAYLQGPISFGMFDFQEFCYVPQEVLAKKIGEEAAMAFPAITMPQNALRGDPIDLDDDAAFAAQYPNLTAAAEEAWQSYSETIEEKSPDR